MPAKYPLEWKDLHKPAVIDLCECIQGSLMRNFQHVTVTEVDCPDLSEEPWSLAASGICGSPKLLDVGAVSYLIPTPQKDKIYKFEDLAENIGNKDAFFIGASHPGFQLFDGNGEMMVNLRVGVNENLQTRITNFNEENKIETKVYGVKDFGLMGNFLSSEGKSGKVIKVHVKTRIGKDDFIQSIRSGLIKSYPQVMIGLGGVFLIRNGKAKLHVMPRAIEKPLYTDDDINEWLTFHEVSAPLVCFSVFYNIDQGMDLRIEHTHCFGTRGDGGHYHCDITPDIVEYEGYFVVADSLLRVDRPPVTHNIGRM